MLLSPELRDGIAAGGWLGERPRRRQATEHGLLLCRAATLLSQSDCPECGQYGQRTAVHFYVEPSQTGRKKCPRQQQKRLKNRWVCGVEAGRPDLGNLGGNAEIGNLEAPIEDSNS